MLSNAVRPTVGSIEMDGKGGQSRAPMREEGYASKGAGSVMECTVVCEWDKGTEQWMSGYVCAPFTRGAGC